MDLGQVFTKRVVANYMASLFDLNKDAFVLDPCFGDGAFLDALKDADIKNITGYEIDKSLFEECKEKYPTYELINGDFLKAPEDVLFDGIIMNPPYVRHEKINDLIEIGVDKAALASNAIFSVLPTTANLYMYFILKAVSLLKEQGQLIVIFPGSWLQAKNGDRFGEALYQSCSIERQIHISGQVFEKSAMVDVIILKLRKDKKNNRAVTEYIKYENKRFIPCEPVSEHISLELNVPFKDIGTVRRGLTTGFNSFYINPGFSYPEGAEYIHPIISSPKQISGFSTEDAETDALLVINKKDIEDAELALYVEDWKNKILENERPQTLVRKIKLQDDWYSLKPFDCNGIIFSYFVRRDMKFINNDSNRIIRDNFYIIYPNMDKWLCFALLNNLYTFYQLECCGKKYGAGLLKLQRYDIEKLYFHDVEDFETEDVNHLKECARKLANTGNRQLIDEITRTLSLYSKVEYSKIKDEYENVVRNRLENK